MKKLLILFCLIPFALLGQKTYVRTQVDGTDAILRRAGDTLNPYVPYANRIDLGEALDDELITFNITNYGAISNDGVEDQSSIQAAIDAAAAFGAWSEREGGKVIIPGGKWYVTDSIVLKSNIEISIDANAYFAVPTNYKKSIWYIGPYVANTYVHGGYYGGFTADKTWKGINIQASNNTTSYAVFNRFSQMIFENAKWAINIETTSTGWANGNTFDNINILRPLTAIRTRKGASSEGLDGNIFHNFQIQPDGDFEYGIDGLDGSDNQLTDIIIWDMAYLDPTAVTVSLATNATMNYLSGMNLTGKNFNTIRDRNIVKSAGITAESTFEIGAIGTNIDSAWLARVMFYIGGSAQDITTDPQIGPGVDGQFVTIIGHDDTNTLTLDDGAGLALSGQFILGVNDCITLVYNKSTDLWIEVSRSNN